MNVSEYRKLIHEDIELATHAKAEIEKTETRFVLESLWNAGNLR